MVTPVIKVINPNNKRLIRDTNPDKFPYTRLLLTKLKEANPNNTVVTEFVNFFSQTENIPRVRFYLFRLPAILKNDPNNPDQERQEYKRFRDSRNYELYKTRITNGIQKVIEEEEVQFNDLNHAQAWCFGNPEYGFLEKGEVTISRFIDVDTVGDILNIRGHDLVTAMIVNPTGLTLPSSLSSYTAKSFSRFFTISGLSVQEVLEMAGVPLDEMEIKTVTEGARKIKVRSLSYPADTEIKNRFITRSIEALFNDVGLATLPIHSNNSLSVFESLDQNNPSTQVADLNIVAVPPLAINFLKGEFTPEDGSMDTSLHFISSQLLDYTYLSSEEEIKQGNNVRFNNRTPLNRGLFLSSDGMKTTDGVEYEHVNCFHLERTDDYNKQTIVLVRNADETEARTYLEEHESVFNAS